MMKNGMEKTPVLAWEWFWYQQWRFCLVVSDRGLCRILQPDEPFEVLERWAAKHFPGISLTHGGDILRPYIKQLAEYFGGKRQNFDLPLDLRGTEFQLAVWRELLAIPYGTTCSYSDLAERLGKPAAVRAVGAANGANPVPLVVPCHRVIGKGGGLTGYRGGLAIKSELLRLEHQAGVSSKVPPN